MNAEAYKIRSSKGLESKDFLRFLQAVLVDRCKRNPRYSLRSFAKCLNVNHAHLSLILRGQRPLTNKFIQKAALALGLKPAKIETFIESEKRKSSTLGEFSIQESNLHFLAEDEFEAIAEWYHDAILELARLPKFKNDPRWISARLGITTVQAADAVERLVRLGFLKFNEDGRVSPEFQDTSTNITPESTSVALRFQQRQILKKSLEALDELPRTLRDHSSLTLAISSKKLSKAKSLIAEFRMRFMEIMQDNPDGYEEVFQLSIGFFPLTDLERKPISPELTQTVLEKQEPDQ
jgi:uncharacterized protein (TIGR02147 family)